MIRIKLVSPHYIEYINSIDCSEFMEGEYFVRIEYDKEDPVNILPTCKLCDLWSLMDDGLNAFESNDNNCIEVEGDKALVRVLNMLISDNTSFKIETLGPEKYKITNSDNAGPKFVDEK